MNFLFYLCFDQLGISKNHGCQPTPFAFSTQRTMPFSDSMSSFKNVTLALTLFLAYYILSCAWAVILYQAKDELRSRPLAAVFVVLQFILALQFRDDLRRNCTATKAVFFAVMIFVVLPLQMYSLVEEMLTTFYPVVALIFTIGFYYVAEK